MIKLSAVIPCFNEKIEDLQVTVAMLSACEPGLHEIVVVDDCTDRYDVREVLSSFPWVTVVVNESQVGAGPSKAHGTDMAFQTGADAAVQLDAHMRIPFKFVEMIRTAVKLYPTSIFCTCCRGFNTLEGSFLACGADFRRTAHVKQCDLWLEKNWIDRGPVEVIDRCPSILGACYVIPKDVWEPLGGLNPNFFGWGSEEDDLSIRSWMYGFEVRRINGLVVPHRFKREMKGYFYNSWEPYFNNLVMAATVFEDGVFEELFEPFMRQGYPKESIDRFDVFRTEIESFRSEVQSARVFSDKELNYLCGLQLPTRRQQEDCYDRWLARRRDEEGPDPLPVQSVEFGDITELEFKNQYLGEPV